tara:strand:- start:407 stop:1033 length:627 start_codon:yes stop_codon:yes gene_type:complete
MNKKYFVIGFNKTATTTFHNLFLQNNLKSQHMKSIYWDTSTYDCFSDITSGDNIWKNLDKIYTDAVFILNIRNLDKWLISRFKHGLRGMLKPNWAYPYTYDKCKSWIYQRECVHHEILYHFLNKPNKLIIVNIDKQNWIDYICSELGFKNNNIISHNVHKTDETNNSHKEIVTLVNSTLDELGYDRNISLISDKELLNKYIGVYNTYI